MIRSMNALSLRLMKFLLIIFLLTPWASWAQDLPAADTTCIQRDLGDVIRSAMNKPVKVKEGKLRLPAIDTGHRFQSRYRICVWCGRSVCVQDA